MHQGSVYVCSTQKKKNGSTNNETKKEKKTMRRGGLNKESRRTYQIRSAEDAGRAAGAGDYPPRRSAARRRGRDRRAAAGSEGDRRRRAGEGEGGRRAERERERWMRNKSGGGSVCVWLSLGGGGCSRSRTDGRAVFLCGRRARLPGKVVFTFAWTRFWGGGWEDPLPPREISSRPVAEPAAAPRARSSHRAPPPPPTPLAVLTRLICLVFLTIFFLLRMVS
jgi:hypothetical protein